MGKRRMLRKPRVYLSGDQKEEEDQGKRGEPGRRNIGRGFVGPPWLMESNAGQQQWY